MPVAQDQVVTEEDVVVPATQEVRNSAVLGKFPVLSAVKGPLPALKSVIVGPSSVSEPMVVVVPSLLKKVLNHIPSSPSSNFLRSLSLLDINHDTLIPSYFNDKLILVYLALLLISTDRW